MAKKFRGDDWTELAERWKCEHDDEGVVIAMCRAHMSSTLGNAKAMAKVAKDIREYLSALVRTEQSHYECPIWRGMLEIKKHPNDENNQYADETLIKYTLELLPCMWT